MISIPTHPTERLRFLDSLRGLAAMWIALFHMVIINPSLDIPVWASTFVRTGRMGNTIFLIVSAFSLCYSMTIHRQGPKPLLSFYIRRFFRIAPLFYVLLVFTILRDNLVLGVNHNPPVIAVNCLFIFNIIPGMQEGIVWASWAIGVWMLLYLLFPLFYKLFNDSWKTATFVIWSILIASLFKFFLDLFPLNLITYHQLTHFPLTSTTYFNFSIIRQLPLFASGMFSFYLLQMISLRDFNIKVIGIFLVGIALFLYIELLCGRLNVFDPYYWEAVIFSVFLLGLAINPIRIIVNDVTTFLGKLSLSLYLCHPPLIYSLIPFYRRIYMWQTSLSIKYLAAVGVTLTLLIAVSFITYHLIEKPGIRLGKKFLKSKM